jgi:hypothetical protein
MQLDIFADSRDVMLRNDVPEALQRRHASGARQAWQRMADEYPEDDTLIALAILVGKLELERDATAYFADHEVLDVARRLVSGPDKARASALPGHYSENPLARVSLARVLFQGTWRAPV